MASDFGPILRALSRNKARASIIVLEVALTLAIVVNCVSLIKDARLELAKQSGFLDDDLISVRVRAFDPAFTQQPFTESVIEKDVAALRALPGVAAATQTRFRPWQGGGSSNEVWIAGTKSPTFRIQTYAADGQTFKSLGITVAEGRDFTDDEAVSERDRVRAVTSQNRPRSADGRATNPLVQEIVVSRAFAKLAFADGVALGKRLEDSDGDQYAIVGVIDRFYNPYAWNIGEYVMFYATRSNGMQYLVRAEKGQRETLLKSLDKALLTVNPGRVVKMDTIQDLKLKNQGEQLFVVKMLGGVIFLLVFVTALGIVGITSFSVAERTRHIGTRRALGAQKTDILRYFLTENWLLTSFGIVLGSGLAFFLNAALVSSSTASRLAPVLLLVGMGIMWVTGILSALAPALRGMRIEPAIATRNV